MSAPAKQLPPKVKNNFSNKIDTHDKLLLILKHYFNRKLQELKSAQDLYLDKLSQDMEDLEQKCIDYEAQV